MSITLGDRVHDKISNFSGVVTGRLEYLNGCRQYLVKPETLDKDGKMIDGMWIDEQTLVLDLTGVMPDPFAVSKVPQRGGPDRPSGSLPR